MSNIASVVTIPQFEKRAITAGNDLVTIKVKAISFVESIFALEKWNWVDMEDFLPAEKHHKLAEA